MKESIYGYHDNRKIPFLRITMALPKLVAPAKRILETGFRCAEFPERAYSTYESNIDYEVSSFLILLHETVIILLACPSNSLVPIF